MILKKEWLNSILIRNKNIWPLFSLSVRFSKIEWGTYEFFSAKTNLTWPFLTLGPLYAGHQTLRPPVFPIN